MSTGLAVETPKTRLVDELRSAQTALRAAETTLRVIENNVAGGNKSAHEHDAAVRQAIDASCSSDGKRMLLQKTKSWLVGEEGKLTGAKDAVQDAKRVLAAVQSKIASDPMYAGVLVKRREFVTRGVEIARRAWSAPLLHITDLVRQYEAIADDEANFVLRENFRLAQAGLPELRLVLDNYRHALPEPIARMDLATLANEATKLIAEMASR
jgi:hypothetical protein